jgi:hypothetical protein
MYAAKDLDKTDRVKAEIVDMGAFELYIERGTMALFR